MITAWQYAKVLVRRFGTIEKARDYADKLYIVFEPDYNDWRHYFLDVFSYLNDVSEDTWEMRKFTISKSISKRISNMAENKEELSYRI
jgi:hypothetical protein